ncbi:MAG: hypothetical protein GY835_14560 [bacterium]|nr:hypothetical protein [bacterium]
MTDTMTASLTELCSASNTELRMLTDPHALADLLAEALDFTEGIAPPTALLEDGRGFTLADGVIAATGSVVLTGRFPDARRVAFLAETHYALAAEEEVHRDLATFLAAANAAGWRSRVGHHVTFITGPSRTADIEKIMVLGAHGPRRLVLGIAPLALLRPLFGDALDSRRKGSS